LSRNLGTLTSWNPLGHSRPVTGLLYLFLLIDLPVQTGSETHPAYYTMDAGSFPGVKQPGRGIDHPLPSATEVKNKVMLYVYPLPPSGPSRPVLG